jgi:hypothetical protein
MHKLQDKKIANATFIGRVEKLKLIKDWTWDEVAKKLHLTRGMLHFIKQGRYGVSKRNQYRLEQLEKDEGLTPGAKELIEAVVSNVENSKVKITSADFDKGYVDVPVKYARGEPPKGYPKAIRLLRPNVKVSAKLIVDLLTDEDYGSVLLSCIQPRQFATQEFLNLLTPFSFRALTETARSLVFGIHWRQRFNKS